MSRQELVKNIVAKIENGVFVEIGTYLGDFSEFILENSVNSTLYCIDPYISYNTYDDALNNMVGDNQYQSAYNRLYSKYGDRVKFIRKFSEEAVNDVPDQIDFLYIDGNHRYSYVCKDLELYYPKVKNDCYIIGDDAVDINDADRNENGDVLHTWGPGVYGNYGVIKAFREFCITHNLSGNLAPANQYVIKNNIY
jgi:hypothetical protein